MLTSVKVVVRDVMSGDPVNEVRFVDEVEVDLPDATYERVLDTAIAFPATVGVTDWFGVDLNIKMQTSGGDNLVVQLVVDFFHPLREVAYATLTALLVKFLSDELDK